MNQPAPYRIGRWLPSDHRILDDWVRALVADVHGAERQLHPLVQELQDLIEGDAHLYMRAHQMFTQIPKRAPFDKSPTGEPQVRDYRVMLQLISAVMTTAPVFDRTALVGCPLNAILDWSMGTEGGVAFFLSEKINRQLKKILNEWGRFLSSRDSAYVLTTDPHRGWFGKDAMAAMPDFEADFACDPAKPHRGFASWDDFFTRRFRPGRRPVASPGDGAVVVNACESAPYRIARGVTARDRFWIKAQPYSLLHMLANDAFTEQFVGGTVYQAYLSPLSYHRWHCPVDGAVVRAYVREGTYYAEALAEGLDPEGPNESQGYIAGIATRAIVFIEADNPDIGLMAFMGIGMAEVSTCDVTVYDGQRVGKGDELGMFHFGGSTHCLIFRPGVDLDFDLHGQAPGLHSANIRVNARIATVKSAAR